VLSLSLSGVASGVGQEEEAMAMDVRKLSINEQTDSSAEE
jgi:hypothetical protein